MEVYKTRGWTKRPKGKSRQKMQRKNHAPSNNQLKKPKVEDTKKKLQPRKLSPKETRIRGD
jgi:hypothetical protein